MQQKQNKNERKNCYTIHLFKKCNYTETATTSLRRNKKLHYTCMWVHHIRYGNSKCCLCKTNMKTGKFSIKYFTLSWGQLISKISWCYWKLDTSLWKQKITMSRQTSKQPVTKLVWDILLKQRSSNTNFCSCTKPKSVSMWALEAIQTPLIVRASKQPCKASSACQTDTFWPKLCNIIQWNFFRH